ncbi:MAG: hypothetical protein WCL18_08440 [bacterium]
MLKYIYHSIIVLYYKNKSMNTNDKVKRILCYGDSNTWGRVPSSMGMERYPIHNRWPGILQELLGDTYEIIEE